LFICEFSATFQLHVAKNKQVLLARNIHQHTHNTKLTITNMQASCRQCLSITGKASEYRSTRKDNATATCRQSTLEWTRQL